MSTHPGYVVAMNANVLERRHVMMSTPTASAPANYRIPLKAAARDRRGPCLSESEAIRRIEEASGLSVGWNGYDAPAPARIAVEHARRLADLLPEFGLPPVFVGATAMGGIGFTFEAGQREAVCEFYNDGKVFAMFSSVTDPDDVPLIRPVDSEVLSLRELLEEMRDYLNA